jgi:small subunit ribosomal protein S1
MAELEVEQDVTVETPADIQTRLQEKYFKTFESLEEGQLVDGVVVQITHDQVFVDVGYKSEGKIPVTDFEELPAIGDKVNVLLIAKEGKHGDVIVSKKKADEKQLWKDVKDAFTNKTPIRGTIVRVIRGGFDVDIGGGTHAFLPISQADIVKVEEPDTLVGMKADFYVGRLYSSDNKVNIVVNRRKFLEETMETKRAEFFANTQIGDEVKGTVKSFTSFGAFIDLGGFDGLLHINDMSWGHVTRPKEFVKKGQEIDLKVIRLEPEEKRINLSLKHFTEDPWVHFEDKFHVNDVVKGRVTKLTDFGAFIELEDGIEGLAHISEFSWVKKVNRPSDMLKIGDEVECMVLGYDIQAGRVSLGLKQVTVNPLDSLPDKYPVGTKLTREVVKLTNAGAFIRLEDGIDGFLHVDDISWTKKVRYPGSELTLGKEYDVVVVANDPEERRVRLGIKQLTEDPWQDFAARHKSGSTIDGEIVSITDFGIFVRVDDGIEGLINKANLTESKEETFEEAVKKYHEGDKITVFVVDVNADKQKVAFSVREMKKKQERDEISQYMSSSKDDDGDSYTLGDMLKNRGKE